MATVQNPPAEARARRRASIALFAAAALMNAAMSTASALATIVAADQLGTAWGGVPNTAGIAGTGIGALALTGLMNRRGRRAGLLLGYAAAACGAAVAVIAVAADNIAVLSAGMLLLGLGNAAAQLSRYAAAELFPPQRRGFAISIMVWAGTVGAVGGPLLLLPTSVAASSLGWIASTGPFLFASLACGVAAVAVTGAPAGAVRRTPPRARLRDLMNTYAARSALTVMATAQVVMVAVMTAAPLDMHMHGQGLDSVGAVLSAHTFGMFALSPLTGRLLDRIGIRPVLFGGLLVLAISAGLAATVSPHSTVPWALALFLLGYGWNLCFVGGSAQLGRSGPAEQARVEGAVDAGVWGAAATVSLGATATLSLGGYPLLAGVAGIALILPAIILLRWR
ncbi:MFS transporter [Amycolatopsis rhizosphaerae]|uniref:MFS transporter n=1 Tax=Amycolatopsis rhizosphaerae TaxID=2053003 RepID=A0A558CYG5_9PSEU|nr:MFS transporter [Amycolatopsis rhizosphaerae]TVT53809.1 MFS transporter [Amycolatopsis rhizosphaerae]